MKMVKLKMWLSAFLVLPVIVFSEVVFIDNFKNGVVQNSDSVDWFWTSTGEGGGGLGGAIENNGELGIFAGRNTGTSSSEWIIASEPQSMFNFVSDQGLSFEVMAPNGRVLVEQSNFTDQSAARLRFSITQQLQLASALDDAIELFIAADQTGLLRFRENGRTPWIELASFRSATDIVGFRLSLTATNFELTLFDSNGAVSAESGKHYINRTVWSKPLAVALTVQDQGSPEGAQVNVALDSFTVSKFIWEK